MGATELIEKPGVTSTLPGGSTPAARLGLKPLQVRNVSIWPPIIAAPMAGESGSVLRILCRRLGAGLVCTELTSSHGLYYRNQRSFKFIRWTDEEHPVSAQIFGAEPDVMGAAAAMCSEAGADLIDINMGCWVPKVAKTGAGASMLKDLKLAAAVMTAVVKASSVPVTIKTRIGWDGCVGSAVEMGKVAQDCGVAAIAIHGRTAIQGFTGTADWTPIREAKEALTIPVIGNGDVCTPQDAERMFLETGCDAVMIGRAILGNPWIFRETAGYLLDGVHVPRPEPEERLAIAREHARLLALQEYGGQERDTPLPPIARGQLSHYLTQIHHAASARRRMTQVNVLGDAEDLIDELLALGELLQARQPRGRELCLSA